MKSQIEIARVNEPPDAEEFFRTIKQEVFFTWSHLTAWCRDYRHNDSQHNDIHHCGPHCHTLPNQHSVLCYYHVRYLGHLALQVGSSNWVYKTQIQSIQRWHHFGAKTNRSAFLLEKRLHRSLYWIQYSWSGSTIILYYINLSVSWNTLLRNQILLCQHIFYYTMLNAAFLSLCWVLYFYCHAQSLNFYC